MDKHSFATVVIAITFTVVSLVGLQSYVSLHQKVEILNDKLESSSASSELKLNQLLGGMMFLNNKIGDLYNIEIMRSSPDFQKKMEEYNKGFNQTKEGEKNEEDAFNRSFKPPTDETK